MTYGEESLCNPTRLISSGGQKRWNVGINGVFESTINFYGRIVDLRKELLSNSMRVIFIYFVVTKLRKDSKTELSQMMACIFKIPKFPWGVFFV